MDKVLRIPRYDEIKVGSVLYDAEEYESGREYIIDLNTIDDLVQFLLYQNYYINADGVECYGISLENYLIEDGQST